MIVGMITGQSVAVEADAPAQLGATDQRTASGRPRGAARAASRRRADGRGPWGRSGPADKRGAFGRSSAPARSAGGRVATGRRDPGAGARGRGLWRGDKRLGASGPRIPVTVCSRVFAVLLFAGLLLVTDAVPAGAGTPRRGGTLTLANRADPPAGFDTMFTSSIALHHVGGALFGPGNLVKRSRDDFYTVAPYLALRWEHTPDFKEWTFVLRSDVYWHDGTRLTAADVKFWLDLVFFGVRSGQRVRPPAYFARELGDAVAVEIPDPRRVRITFSHRNAHFLQILANPRFKIAHPRHLMEPRIEAGDVMVSPLDVGLVGVGPFRIERYRRGSLVRVERFDRYFERDRYGNRLPHLNRIDYVTMPDPFAMDMAFRGGRLDGGARGQGHFLSSERVAAYERELGDAVFFARSDGGNFRLAFNVLNEGPWQDSRVRRAIALWIDKPAAIPAALGGFGWTTPSIGPGDIDVPTEFINWPRYDTAPLEIRRAEARRLMEEAGYGDGFTMGHLTRAIMPEGGEFLKAQLAGLGVDLELQIVDEGEWNRARVSLDYDSQQGRLTPSPIPEGTESVYGRYEENPDAYSKHDDRTLDALYRQLRDSVTMEQRIEVWRRLSRYLFYEQSYIVPVAESIDVVPYRADVRGLVVPPEDMHTHTDFATVWLER